LSFLCVRRDLYGENLRELLILSVNQALDLDYQLAEFNNGANKASKFCVFGSLFRPVWIDIRFSPVDQILW
jgi:hypothetical protein